MVKIIPSKRNFFQKNNPHFAFDRRLHIQKAGLFEVCIVDHAPKRQKRRCFVNLGKHEIVLAIFKF
jgi:hypothetical protein